MADQRVHGMRACATTITLLATLFACGRQHGPAPVHARSDTAKSARSASATDEPAALAARSQRAPRAVANASGSAEARLQRDALLDTYRCRTNQCESENLGASSAAEASWLKTRGFPTPDHAAELEQMSVNELESASGRGDQAAQAVLGRRMMEQGDEVEGMGRIAQVAVAGNVYADYQLSLGYRNTNPLDSAAYLRRAYLQGDAKAAMIMYMTFPQLGPVEWNSIDKRAMGLYAGLLSMRAGRGPMPTGPRPQGQ